MFAKRNKSLSCTAPKSGPSLGCQALEPGHHLAQAQARASLSPSPGSCYLPAHICTHNRPNNYTLSGRVPSAPRPQPCVPGSPPPSLRPPPAAGSRTLSRRHARRRPCARPPSPAPARCGWSGEPRRPGGRDPGPPRCSGRERPAGGEAGSGCSCEAPRGGRRGRRGQRAKPGWGGGTPAAVGLGERRLAHSPQSGGAARRGSGTGPGGASVPCPSGPPRNSRSRCRPRSR